LEYFYKPQQTKTNNK